ASVAGTLRRQAEAGLPQRVLIDASHGNSGKDHRRQLEVAKSVAGQVAAGNRGIVGLMLESFLADGRQELILGAAADLVYGRSVTDACLGWESTVSLLRELAQTAQPATSAPTTR
ncbi:MAG: 3-deoxy-7-phosphoheptulonate synthase, partial [Candidatus Dormibacteraeota bacterium]|nr:3-deoxy-7-phosphoheptulonate synthase [Candidatus Dormibacteraeota bacterium]